MEQLEAPGGNTPYPTPQQPLTSDGLAEDHPRPVLSGRTTEASSRLSPRVPSGLSPWGHIKGIGSSAIFKGKKRNGLITESPGFA